MSLIDELAGDSPAPRIDTLEYIKVIDEAISKLCEGDTGSHWEQTVIEAARTLMQSDRAEFQRKRTELKKANPQSQVTEWTKAVKGSSDDDICGDSRADEIVTMVTNKSELFHSAKRKTFATFENNNHKETWELTSSGFSDWIGFICYTELGFSPSETAVKQALTSLMGIAKYEGDDREVFMRCAPTSDGYIIDLCNDDWQAIQITSDGWKVISNPSVKFIRSATSTALPTPTSGDLSLLWNHVNIQEELRPLALAFILESWRPDTAFTVLAITGEQGSAKSSTHTRIRQLSDPNEVPLRTMPKSVEDIFVAASNNWQASFENISKLTNGMQDAMCTLSTGGGFASRKLFSNSDESVMEVKRPIIINSIISVTTRPDLIDRVVALGLKKIDPDKKRRDSELDTEFERDAPKIFAGLLDLFSETLSRLPSINIKYPPRMIDFAYLGEAMHQSMGYHDGEFYTLYKANRVDTLTKALDSSPAALAVREMMTKRRVEWEGTLGSLKAVLDRDYRQDGDGWPRSARGLREMLLRMTPALRELGLEVEFIGHKNDGSHVRLFFPESFFQLENNRHNHHTITSSEPKSDEVMNVTNTNHLKKTPEEKTSKKMTGRV